MGETCPSFLPLPPLADKTMSALIVLLASVIWYGKSKVYDDLQDGASNSIVIMSYEEESLLEMALRVSREEAVLPLEETNIIYGR